MSYVYQMTNKNETYTFKYLGQVEKENFKSDEFGGNFIFHVCSKILPQFRDTGILFHLNKIIQIHGYRLLIIICGSIAHGSFTKRVNYTSD